MTKATTATKTKKPATPSSVRRCKNPICKKQFRTKSAVKIYCKPECKTAVGNAKKKVKHVDKATNSAFFYHLAYEVQRAGSYQVLSGHDLQSLIQLNTLYKRCLRYNNYGDLQAHETQYEISHIAPVKGNNTLGLYHPDNLVIAPSEMNRAHGTKYYGGGLSISRARLDLKYAVSKDAQRSKIVAGIIQFLGETLVSDLVREAKIQPTQRHKVMSWLLDHLNPLDPEHKTHLATIDELSTKALTQLKATVQGKLQSSFSLGGICGAAPDYVLLNEWKRIANTTRPDILPAFNVLDDLNSNSSNRFSVGLSATEQQLVFDMLHGGPVDLVTDIVAREVVRANSKPMYNYTGTASIAIEVPVVVPEPRSKVIAITPTPTVQRSFSEELDAPVAYDIPVFLPPFHDTCGNWDMPDFAR